MILPGATLGVLGGGQLGRMFTLAAKVMGYSVVVLDPDPDSPAGALADVHLKADYRDAVALIRMGGLDDAERAEIKKTPAAADLGRIYYAKDLVTSPSAIFCATGISDSPLLPGVRLIGRKVITHSILMRSQSRTVRYIKTVHDLDFKTIRRSPDRRDHYV